jgi:hypothetical protein
MDYAKIVEALPHGSGINDPWVLEEKFSANHWRVIARNVYYGMNEWGMYDGACPFAIHFEVVGSRSSPKLVLNKITYTGNPPRWKSWYWGLREYLYELILEAISDGLRL